MMKKLFQALSVRTVALSLALVLSIGSATGGTLAWLMEATPTLVNTFTYGDVNITLTETPIDPATGLPAVDEEGKLLPPTAQVGQTYKMLPGATITKNPTVTILAGSEPCYVFVKIDQSANFVDFMEYTVAEGWTALEGAANVYYRMYDAMLAEDLAYQVLAGDNVKVKDSVTKAALNGIHYGPDGKPLDTPNYPTLSFTAYAVQKSGIATVADAWTIANNGVISATVEETVENAENGTTGEENADLADTPIETPANTTETPDTAD